MSELRTIFETLTIVQQEQMNKIMYDDNYINVETNSENHILISHSRIKDKNKSVKVRKPLQVIQACDILFGKPHNYSIANIRLIIRQIDIQCTSVNHNTDIIASEMLLDDIDDLNNYSNEDLEEFSKIVKEDLNLHMNYIIEKDKLKDCISNALTNIETNDNDIYNNMIKNKNQGELTIMFHDVVIEISEHSKIYGKLLTIFEEIKSISYKKNMATIDSQISDINELFVFIEENLINEDSIKIMGDYNLINDILTRDLFTCDNNDVNELYNKLINFKTRVTNKLDELLCFEHKTSEDLLIKLNDIIITQTRLTDELKDNNVRKEQLFNMLKNDNSSEDLKQQATDIVTFIGTKIKEFQIVENNKNKIMDILKSRNVNIH